jgi:hypothetical protein
MTLPGVSALLVTVSALFVPTAVKVAASVTVIGLADYAGIERSQ